MTFAALGEGAKTEAGDEEIEKILAGMTLEEKVGQMMIASFRIWKEAPEDGSEGDAAEENSAKEPPAVNITELNDEIRQCIAEDHFGGMLLFAENCRDAEQTLRLVADMQKANQAGGGLPMLVAADQEGGVIARLGFGTTGPGNMALTAAGDPENARTMAAVYGRELKLLGIHADYAPVMDMNSNPDNPVIGVRSFSDVPEVAADYGKAFIAGLHSEGTIATVKHFPGHGDTNMDSHTGLPRIDKSYEELKGFELIPFRAAIDAGADMVMTAHIQYPQIEKGTYNSTSLGKEVYLPATMSRTILTDILRKDMGFEGVIVSDALDMASIADHFAEADVLKMTINAGVDMLILPSVKDTNLFRKSRDMVALAVELVKTGEVDAKRVDDAVRRILTLKKKYGLLEQRDFSATDETVIAAKEGIGSAEHRRQAWEIACKALTLVKNEGNVFPVSLRSGERALILFADSCASRGAAGELAKHLLEQQSALPDGAELKTMVHMADNREECLRVAEEADHVILVHRVYSAACMNPETEDGFSTALFDKIIEARHAAGRRVIVVSCQLPYDAARFTEADAMLLAYCSSPMRAVPPETGEGSAYAPNLPAALCACFSAGTVQGKLPVNLPAMNERYELTEETLYQRDPLYTQAE